MLIGVLALQGGFDAHARILRGLGGYAASGADPNMLRLYTLLGDPAIRIHP